MADWATGRALPLLALGVAVLLLAIVVLQSHVLHSHHVDETGPRSAHSVHLRNQKAADSKQGEEVVGNAHPEGGSFHGPDLGFLTRTGADHAIHIHQGEHEVGKRRKRIAFAISITKDGSFQDGAAVLAYSIIKEAQRHKEDTDVSLVAFVHPLVSETRPVLTKLGFHVIETPMPINITAIEHKWLREKINFNGCCGASELIKLNSYRLSQYDNIVHMDADTMLLNPVNELLGTNYSLIYTTDPNMATHKGEDKMPAQGGFLVIKPSDTDFRAIIDTIMTTEFVSGGAWNRTKIGWFWGGMTVQGILPYYYNRVTQPNIYRRKIVDRCLYNTMADTKECESTPLEKIKSAHFTVCQKPWTCYKGIINDLCHALHQKWFALREEAEAFYGIPAEEKPCGGPRGGRYRKMRLDGAAMPDDSAMFLPVPDESPSLLEPPFPESRYVGHIYDNFVGGHVNKPKPKPKPKPAPHK
jgi:hypothetical protein